MSKQDNKKSYRLRLRLSNNVDPKRKWHPSSIEEVLDSIDEVFEAVNRKPQPAYAECPGYDGECMGCKVCNCHEHY